MSKREALQLNILRDFTLTPGPRFRHEGPFSGEQFREEVLVPKFKEALQAKTTLHVDLDGTAGYGTSFLEESFGGLARIYSPDLVLKHIELKSEEDAYLAEDVIAYIEEANDNDKTR
jgi:hypothetical protein